MCGHAYSAPSFPDARTMQARNPIFNHAYAKRAPNSEIRLQQKYETTRFIAARNGNNGFCTARGGDSS